MYSNGTNQSTLIRFNVTNYDQVAFWVATTAIDIIIDITLIILSTHLVWSLRLENYQKVLATLLFSLRLL
jgi:hypothetical protein